MGDRDQTDTDELRELARLRVRVSELQQALERLQNSTTHPIRENETFRKIFQHHSAVMYVFDPSTLSIIDANEAALSFYGYSREAFLTKRICDLNPLGEEEIRKELAQDEASGKNCHVLEHSLSNGDTRHVEIYTNAVNLPERQVYFSIVHDITERKQADEALRESEKKYRSLVDNSPLGILYSDTEGKILEVNRSLLEMLGSPSAEATKALNILTFPLVVKAGISELFRRCMEAGETQIAEVPYMSRWGKEVEWRVIVTPVFDRHGVVVGCQAMTEEITERKRAERELRKEKLFTESALDALTDAFIVFDLEGRFLRWNKTLRDVTGYNDREISAMKPTDFFAEHDVPRVAHGLASAVRQGHGTLEATVVTKDGEHIPYEFTGDVLLDSDGNPSGICAVGRDISERMRAQERIKQQNEFLNSVLESLTHPFYVIDAASYNVVMANSASGWKLDSERATCYSLSHGLREPCDTSEHQCPLQQVVTTGRPATVEHVHYDKEGNPRDFEVHVYPILDPHGQVVQVIEYSFDITERKKTEAALRESEERYRSLVENIDMGVTLIDSEYNVVMTNAAQAEILGVPGTGLLGRKCFQALASRSQPCERCTGAQAMDGGQPVEAETELIGEDGLCRNLRTRVFPIFAPDGPGSGWIEVVEDVTERKRLEEQLQHAVKMEAIGRLAGGVAHDFNNLLTAMIGNAGILLGQMDADDARRHRVTQISFAAERAAELTRQLLAFSRKQVLEVKVLDLNDVIRDFTKILRRLVGEDINIVTAFEPSLGTVSADPGQLEQILMNLAVNARDAMPLGGTLTIETANVVLDADYARTHTEVRSGSYVMFAVGDTGVGMDDATLGHVFDPFFTTKEKGRGTGLGLSTVFGIVKQHQGHISVYSEPALGTVFRVYLPRVEKPADSLRTSHDAVPQRPATETLLVVEDEGIVRTLACELLEMMGYSVLSAANPEEALRIADQHPGVIHLLLTDVVLPQMDGMSLFRRLSPERPGMKVLYVSGYTQNFIVHHGVLRPGVHFLQKPFTLDSLATKVRDVLDEPEGTPSG